MVRINGITRAAPTKSSAGVRKMYLRLPSATSAASHLIRTRLAADHRSNQCSEDNGNDQDLHSRAVQVGSEPGAEQPSN